MTTIRLMSILTIFLIIASKSANPVKTSLAILGVRVFIFLQMRILSGTSWVPVLMVLLFMGGIIIMFIILSSVLPNEKRIKVKNYWVFAPILAIAVIGWNWERGVNPSPRRYKRFLSSGNNFWIIIILIITYFISGLRVLRTEDTPMRTLYCY